MQLTDAPDKIVLPFADGGGKNTIPVDSQIGITAGAASFTDGFPPLTRVPKVSGGVPPFGLDMNGILYDATALERWFASGAGFVFDAGFANDPNVGGYPKGARVLRSDGKGYWVNTVDDNTTDPEDSGSAAAGWVPDLTPAITLLTMASSNVTLTPTQYGRPIIAITGTLTTNLNLVFPDGMPGQWVVRNGTSGSYTITAKTASGSGVALPASESTIIYTGGDNMHYAAQDMGALQKTGGTMTGNLTMSGAVINGARGAGIASAATVDLDAATGNHVHITGTTTITAITLAEGALRTVVFNSALTLTNGANLILPGGVNIAVSAGSSAIFVGEGSGVTRCLSYFPVVGTQSVGAPADQSLTTVAAQYLTFAHGLGATPDDVVVKLICTSADLSYSVNDQIVLGKNAGYGGYGVTVRVDSTNVYVRTGENGIAIATNTGSNVLAQIADAKWDMRIRAVVYN